jgi:hypothetical protein
MRGQLVRNKQNDLIPPGLTYFIGKLDNSWGIGMLIGINRDRCISAENPIGFVLAAGLVMILKFNKLD